VEQLLAEGAAAFVPKPATLAALVRALRRAVAGERDHEPNSSR
jgi:DNA-binding NarL/FixJ family response regulator